MGVLVPGTVLEYADSQQATEGTMFGVVDSGGDGVYAPQLRHSGGGDATTDQTQTKRFDT